MGFIGQGIITAEPKDIIIILLGAIAGLFLGAWGAALAFVIAELIVIPKWGVEHPNTYYLLLLVAVGGIAGASLNQLILFD